MQQTMMNVSGSSRVAQLYPARPARRSTARTPLKICADRRSPLVVNAALATRAPPTFLQPVPWTEIFQALVLPAPVAAPKRQPSMEEECPWLDEMEDSRRHPMYVSHLANRMAMEPQDE